jgi:hypothetical protein
MPRLKLVARRSTVAQFPPRGAIHQSPAALPLEEEVDLALGELYARYENAYGVRVGGRHDAQDPGTARHFLYL